MRRLQLSVNAFLTYPFGRPGYQYTDVPEQDERSLDMLRCPVAGAGCCDFRFHSLSATDVHPEQLAIRPLPMVTP